MKYTITERPSPHTRKLAALALSAAIGFGASSAGAQAKAAEASQAQHAAATPQVQQVQATSTPQQEATSLNDLQQQFTHVSQRINAIQQQAIQDDAVKQKHNDFTTAMNDAVLGLNKEAKELIDEQDTLRLKILNSAELANPGAERSPEFMAEVQKYQALEQQLAPMRQQVAQEPAVLQKQKEFESALISKMEEIDAETPQLLENRQKIVEQYRQAMQSQQ